jgi:hypothetical protein
VTTIMPEQIILSWVIMTFDRRKPKFPLERRTWFLDWDKISPNERDEILSIIRRPKDDPLPPGLNPFETEQVTLTFSEPDLRMLKYRDRFEERPGFDFNEAKEHYSSFLGVNLGVEYFEDETGKPIKKFEMYRLVTGEENPVIRGDVESVLRLSSMSTKNDAVLDVQESNTISHLVEVVDLIASGSWYNTPPSLTSVNNPVSPSISANRPHGESTSSALIYIRQLYASDTLFNRACGIYCKYCSDRRKVDWIQNLKERFNEFLDAPVGFPPIPEVNVQTLADSFLYGTGLLHSRKTQKTQEWEKCFKMMLEKYGEAHVVMAVHASLRLLLNFVLLAVPVIRQDYKYWFYTGKSVKPTRISLRSILAEKAQERGRPDKPKV